MSEADFSTEIATFMAHRAAMMLKHGPCWVIVLDTACEGPYSDYESAIDAAIQKYPDRDFLIRPIDEAEPHIPLVVVEAA